MSHHFDYPQDERLDITDAYCFRGASDARGPRTVFGMNASPSTGKPWDPAGYYELKIDTNEDYVEDITWRFTFPVDSAGTQHVQVAELTGKEATSRTTKGRIITPPGAPVGEVLHLDRGIKVFAGKRTDPFFNFIPFPVAVAKALADGTFPDLAALFPPHDSFLDNSVRSVLVEAPVAVTGFRLLNYWASTAIYDQGHRTWLQLQRAGGPNTTTFWNFEMGPAQININATVPSDDLAGRPACPDTDPASGVWGQMRDQTAAVVAAGGTYNQGIHGQPTALAYGAWVADTLLPNVLPFIPGTNALWDPWHDIHNGKGLIEDAADNVTRMVLNQDFTSGLTQPAPLLDYFPYLPPPPPES
jgi:Domain of unknown function (DUF4331)